MGEWEWLRYRELIEVKTPEEAIKLQKKLANSVVLQPLSFDFSVLAAADLAYVRELDSYVAVVATFSWPDLKQLEIVSHIGKVRFPYIPGLLSFREVPAIFEAWRKLERKPDVFLCDGQGIAHPRGLGLASHLGLLLDIPTVGCAKARLCGHHAELGIEKGVRTFLYLDKKVIGVVLRSRAGVKPLYVSPGHKTDIESSVRLVEKCLGRYRIPEPLRVAHREATQIARRIKLDLSRENQSLPSSS
ncbi:deoxyribonuclease V [Thermodesulforhabdus norvegica]|uniref:Endonuclease V n=1 Tax=Thermodesulforhabdus norvegica TaxID=39841 RepID=A0A1I4RL20_9BACT|nr:deoxyribonuclease V [Thermodesulforhabdus norvegica]SFM52921.1 Endonuclease V [Thermodesulforhabdus norvegica]